MARGGGGGGGGGRGRADSSVRRGTFYGTYTQAQADAMRAGGAVDNSLGSVSERVRTAAAATNALLADSESASESGGKAQAGGLKEVPTFWVDKQTGNGVGGGGGGGGDEGGGAAAAAAAAAGGLHSTKTFWMEQHANTAVSYEMPTLSEFDRLKRASLLDKQQRQRANLSDILAQKPAGRQGAPAPPTEEQALKAAPTFWISSTLESKEDSSGAAASPLAGLPPPLSKVTAGVGGARPAAGRAAAAAVHRVTRRPQAVDERRGWFGLSRSNTFIGHDSNYHVKNRLFAGTYPGEKTARSVQMVGGNIGEDHHVGHAAMH